MKFEGPVIYTNDIKKSVEFYKTILGLKLENISSGNFASISYDNGSRMGIKQKAEKREIPGAQTITFYENDI